MTECLVVKSYLEEATNQITRLIHYSLHYYDSNFSISQFSQFSLLEGEKFLKSFMIFGKFR